MKLLTSSMSFFSHITNLNHALPESANACRISALTLPAIPLLLSLGDTLKSSTASISSSIGLIVPFVSISIAYPSMESSLKRGSREARWSIGSPPVITICLQLYFATSSARSDIFANLYSEPSFALSCPSQVYFVSHQEQERLQK